MIKAVFFDVGGVLVRRTGLKSITLTARLLGMSARRLAPVYEPLLLQVAEGRMSERKFWHTIARRYRLPTGAEKRLVTFLKRRKPHHILRTRAIARRLKQNGYIVGILSDIVPTHERTARQIGVYRGFHPVVLSWRIRASKRMPEAFRIAAQRAKVKYPEMVFFDDHQEHVAVARKLGIKAFVYKNPAQLVRSLRRLGVRI